MSAAAYPCGALFTEGQTLPEILRTLADLIEDETITTTGQSVIVLATPSGVIVPRVKLNTFEAIGMLEVAKRAVG